MEGIIGNRFLCPLAPLLIRLDQVLLRIRDSKVDDHRRTAGKAGRSARVEVFGGDSSHERQLHMRVRIDTAGHDELATGIHHASAGWCFHVLADAYDLSIAAKYVCFECAVGINNRAAFD